MNKDRMLFRVTRAEEARTAFITWLIFVVLSALSILFSQLLWLTPWFWPGILAILTAEVFCIGRALGAYKLWLARYHNKYAQAGYARLKDIETRLSSAR